MFQLDQEIILSHLNLSVPLSDKKRMRILYESHILDGNTKIEDYDVYTSMLGRIFKVIYFALIAFLFLI